MLRISPAPLALLAVGLAVGCHGIDAPDTVLTQLLRARALVAELRVLVQKAAEAEKRSVMADTDEASAEFAREAESANREVAARLEEIKPLLDRLSYGKERSLIGEFERSFTESAALDREILALAVENTNLKAQRLSFGPVRDAAEEIHRRLDGMVNVVPTQAQDGARLSAMKALLALRDLQLLEAPHIAEPDDAEMTRLERRMSEHEADVRVALRELDQLGGSAARAALASAAEAFERFLGLHAQVVELSRRNTNVRSLALSLGRKRKLTAACDESLAAVGTALAARGFRATR
jgi:hypothetical protein